MRISESSFAGIAGLVIAIATLNLGCASEGPPMPEVYKPVMSIKAHSPTRVTVLPFQSTREADRNAAEWIRGAVIAELEHAGFTVLRENQPGSAATNVSATLSEFGVDMTIDGYKTHIRIKFVVSRDGVAGLDKEYEVVDNGSGITGSANEHRIVIGNAVTKLMRRSMPEVMAAVNH